MLPEGKDYMPGPQPEDLELGLLEYLELTTWCHVCEGHNNWEDVWGSWLLASTTPWALEFEMVESLSR